MVKMRGENREDSEPWIRELVDFGNQIEFE